MTVSRTRRVVGFLINLITFQGLIVGNLILLLTNGRTVGGLVAGYKYQHGGVGILLLAVMNFLVGILSLITFGIFMLVDWITMGNRDGTFAESWAGNKKINL